MIAGAVLVAAAAFLFAFNKWDSRRAETAAEEIVPKLGLPAEEKADTPDEADTGVKENTVTVDDYGYIGVLSVPKLELNLPVMSECDYERLRIAPCLYYGSPQTDDAVIAAHNYTSHFGRLYQLEIGDAVAFTDIAGKEYNYRVGDIETLPPDATEQMIHSDWDLSLYTCTYGGQSRVTVRCERTDKEQINTSINKR